MSRIPFFVMVLVLVFSSSQSILAAKKTIYELKAADIATYIAEKSGKKRVIMIYTSWCPHCRNAMPFLIEIEKTEPGSVIALSQDESFDQLAAYVKTLEEIPFDVIMNKEGQERGALEKTLKSEFGIKPWRGFPTYIFIDENNKVIDQGNFHGQTVLDFLTGKYP